MDRFQVSSLWLSPVAQDAHTKRLLHKIRYLDRDSLVVETPVLRIEDMLLLFEEGENKKILMRCRLSEDNKGFRQVVHSIDKRVNQESSFRKTKKFIPSYDYQGVFSFFIPVYQREVSVLVTGKDGSTMSMSSLHRASACKLVLLLSHVEAVQDLFYPVWNIVQIKIAE